MRDNSDVVPRYLRSYGSMTTAHTAAGARVPYAFERYATTYPCGIGLFPTTAASSAGFDWGDDGAGVGTGVAGFVLLVAGWVATPCDDANGGHSLSPNAASADHFQWEPTE